MAFTRKLTRNEIREDGGRPVEWVFGFEITNTTTGKTAGHDVVFPITSVPTKSRKKALVKNWLKSDAGGGRTVLKKIVDATKKVRTTSRETDLTDGDLVGIEK